MVGMMTDVTWPMKTVWNVRRLYVRAATSGMLMDQPGFHDEFRHCMAVSLVDEAHTFGVEIHLDDVEMTEDVQAYDPYQDLHSFIAAWRPITREAELSLPGSQDGRVVTVANVWDALRIPLPGTALIHTDPPTPSIPYVELRVCGWREGARRWVFRQS